MVVFVGRAVVGVRDMCVTLDAKEERANEGGTEQGRFCRSAMEFLRGCLVLDEERGTRFAKIVDERAPAVGM